MLLDLEVEPTHVPGQQLRRAPDVLVPLFAMVNFAMILPLVFVMVPFVRPLKASRLGFTYLIPLIPLLYAWDGTVSALRAYTPEELVALARQAPGAAGYRWEAGRAGSGPRSVRSWSTGAPTVTA